MESNEHYEFFTEFKYNENHSTSNRRSSGNYLLVGINGFTGLIDITGKEIITPDRYDMVYYWEKNNQFVVNTYHYNPEDDTADKWSEICDENMTILTKMRYNNNIMPFEDAWIVESNKKFGLLSANMEYIVPMIYDNIYTGHNFGDTNVERRLVELNTENGRKIGLMDVKGHIHIPIEYDRIYFGWATREPIIYDETKVFNGKVFGALKNKQEYFFDENGNNITDIISKISDNRDYKNYQVISENPKLYSLKKEDKYGIVDNKDEVILPIEYDYIGYKFSEGLISVTLNGLIGFFDTFGNKVIDFKYEGNYNSEFKDDVAVVRKNGKDFLINSKDVTLTPKTYDYITYIQNVMYVDGTRCINSVIIVKEDEKLGIVSEAGVELFAPKYEEILATDNIDFLAKVAIKDVNGNLKYGLIDKNGIEVIPCTYDYIMNFRDIDKMMVFKNSKYGIINSKEEIILPIIYGPIDRIHIENHVIFKVFKGYEGSLGLYERKYAYLKFH